MTFWKWSQTANTNGTADSTCTWPEGMAPSTVNDSARGNMAALAKYRDDTAGIITTGGTSTAYTVTSYQGFDTLAHLANAAIAFVPHATNGATVQLNVDGLGLKPLRAQSGVELPAGALIAGTPYVVTYNNVDAVFYLWGYPGTAMVPLGVLLPYPPTATAPSSNWALPYGQAISRTTYAPLFSLMGTTYGTGDGSTTFNLPDLRGRSPFGKDDMGGSAANRITTAGASIDGTTLGAAGGAQNVTLNSTQIPGHTHTGTTDSGGVDHTHSYQVASGVGFFQPGAGGAYNTVVGATSGGASAYLHTHTFTTGSTGGGGAHTNMPPAIIMPFIMRVL